MVMPSVVAAFILVVSASTKLATSLKLNAKDYGARRASLVDGLATPRTKNSPYTNPNPTCSYDGVFFSKHSGAPKKCSELPKSQINCYLYMYYYDSNGQSPGEQPGNPDMCGYQCCNCVARTAKDMSTCTIFEDPHIESFDGAKVSLLASTATDDSTDGHSSGDKWLVKSERLKIQAHFVVDRALPERNTFVGALAVGGELIQGNVLIIPSLENDITWNGDAILQNQTSFFRVHVGDSKYVKARRSMDSLQVTDLSKKNPGLNIKLPSGVKLIVNRLHHHVNVAIKMPTQDGGQDGLCGNYNGLSADDSLQLAANRQTPLVPDEESLFLNTKFD